MPVTSTVKNDTNTPGWLKYAGLLLAALAFTAFVPAAPAAATVISLVGKGVHMLWKAAASARVGKTAAGPAAVVGVWGFARALIEPDSATVKTALLGPNQEPSQEVAGSNAILIVRINIETPTIGSHPATFLVSRLTMLKKTETHTTNVKDLGTSDSDVLFSIELPSPDTGKSYLLYTASFLRFRNLAPPTAVLETPNMTGGIWEVVKDSSTAGSPPIVEGWVHQMVAESWEASSKSEVYSRAQTCYQNGNNNNNNNNNNNHHHHHHHAPRPAPSSPRPPSLTP
ncbi:hypothetical protein B0H14DRAFT_3762925 [Mycena olivaceomarginata]|nr:hypothetical protein B0H14DRAFT_3762925 [Mycena olivaceomarginata]